MVAKICFPVEILYLLTKDSRQLFEVASLHNPLFGAMSEFCPCKLPSRDTCLPIADPD